MSTLDLLRCQVIKALQIQTNRKLQRCKRGVGWGHPSKITAFEPEKVQIRSWWCSGLKIGWCSGASHQFSGVYTFISRVAFKIAWGPVIYEGLVYQNQETKIITSWESKVDPPKKWGLNEPFLGLMNGPWLSIIHFSKPLFARSGGAVEPKQLFANGTTLDFQFQQHQPEKLIES